VNGPRRGKKRGWGRGRRAARFLEPFLLLFLQQGKAHGYTLLERLQQFGLESRNPSAVYRVLRDMEAWGYVISSWNETQTQGPPRRVYRLTPVGQDILAQHVRDLKETQEIIDRFITAYQRHTVESTETMPDSEQGE